MNKNILVTGANGQLGSEMQILSKTSKERYIFTDVAELDITNLAAIRQMVVKNNIDVIVNCAAYTNVDKAEENEKMANLLNNIAVGHLANVAKEVGATLIHISTDYVFDGVAHIPYTEEHTTTPIGVYGRTKLDGEKSVVASDCNYIIIRTSWLYSQWGNNFVKTIQHLTNGRDSLNVIFDQIGTPTYAGDLANAIGMIINSNQITKKGIYHFSNEGVCSWYDFAKMICSMSGNKCEIHPIHSSEFPSKVTRPHYSVLDKTKIKNTFNIAIPHWIDSLKKCILNLQNYE
ncbi:dTDP-4-dehydrorhamnose reductase [Bacteroides sp.]|uniref:dTDP-4-dehydrorhamnose reductase n=1 Tax=Bacteroides sp. TaxID=29523 RepID=UPI002606F6D0|nr:dTDP-4-dehydrorhamnose reductase [Bacteroides sp.]MDD3038766.1 dTDP-4-dehydrorhamnose reductase [Bacteroides sp.]